MTPTTELREKLRRLLNEKIPAGGTEADTRFLDEEIDDLIEEAFSIYAAAAQGWLEKAGKYQEEMADLEETGAGQERYKLVSLKNRQEYALRMADRYSALADRGRPGSCILKVTKPEALDYDTTT